MGVTNSRTRLSDFHFTTSSVVKNPPAMQEMQEMQVQSLSWEDPLENEIATHSSILAWKSHGQRSLAGYSPWGHKGSGTIDNFTFFLQFSEHFSHPVLCLLFPFYR